MNIIIMQVNLLSFVNGIRLAAACGDSGPYCKYMKNYHNVRYFGKPNHYQKPALYESIFSSCSTHSIHPRKIISQCS